MESPMLDPSICHLKQLIMSTTSTSHSTNSTERGIKTNLDFTQKSKIFQTFTRFYFAGTKIPSKLLDEVVAEDKDFLVSILINDLISRFPIRSSYRRIVLNEVIKKLSSSGEEVAEELYTTMVDVMSDSSEYSHRIYLSDDCSSTRCIVKESNQQLCHGTTGLSVWQASSDLASFMTSFIDCSHKTVLELGAGCGLTGIAIASKFSTSKVILTDFDVKVLAQLQENVDISLSESDNEDRVTVRCLDWLQFDEEDDLNGQVDVVIAADVVYDRHIVPSLCYVLKTLMTSSDHDVVAYVACTLRDPDTLKCFTDELDKQNIHKTSVNYQYGFFSFPDEDSKIPHESQFPFFSPLDTPTVIYQLKVIRTSENK